MPSVNHAAPSFRIEGSGALKLVRSRVKLSQGNIRAAQRQGRLRIVFVQFLRRQQIGNRLLRLAKVRAVDPKEKIGYV